MKLILDVSKPAATRDSRARAASGCESKIAVSTLLIETSRIQAGGGMPPAMTHFPSAGFNLYE
jgi:hypothetical protein